LTWKDADPDLNDHAIGKPVPLVREVERKAVAAILTPEENEPEMRERTSTVLK
jgi:hypothetical protein